MGGRQTLIGRIFRGRKPKNGSDTVVALVGRKAKATEVFGALSDVMERSEDILKSVQSRNSYDNYDQTFDLYDSMVKLDPELNGAVRSVSLTGNNYIVNYNKAKNDKIRSSIRELVEETLDFDDFLINAMRSLMVYGNDVNKLVGRAGIGITNIQSLPIKQVTIIDQQRFSKIDDTALAYTTNITQDNPVMSADYYILREAKVDPIIFKSDEVLHIRIDYRSNWFRDRFGRYTYGVWGASRFRSLEQAVRAKYNTINNRIALEDSLTKQYIKIGKEAVEHIMDPDEAKDRLTHIMDETADLFEGLQGDQTPILPHYIDINHVDLSNTVPDNTMFLDSINGDIAAALHVPRVAAGQERGSTFAATYNANIWAVQAIARLQSVVTQGVNQLFSKHLELAGIKHSRQDLPVLEFNKMEEESPLNRTRRATLGYKGGVMSLNQALEAQGYAKVPDGDKMVDPNTSPSMGDLPREHEQI
tara:strand:+ start:994 stop:2415 length:1422 start_codon:yes stop_codon:yes gene_type:complete